MHFNSFIGCPYIVCIWIWNVLCYVFLFVILKVGLVCLIDLLVFSLFSWGLLLSHFYSAALPLDFRWWAAWSNYGFILPFVAILLTSGTWISRVDSIVSIYPLYNSCRLSEFLIVLNFAIRFILNFSRLMLSRFLWVMIIYSFFGWSCVIE